MNTYLKMWKLVKELTPEQTQEWIDKLAPAKGTKVRFRDIFVLDIDVLSALYFMREEYEQHPRQPNFD